MLIPKEHGAYGQVLFPLATVLAAGHPSAVAWGFAAAAVGGFLAHEGLAVLFGRRGTRVLRARRRVAVQSVALWGGIGVIAGVLAFRGATTEARVAAAVTVGLAGVVMALVRTRLERTVAGEVLVAVTLASWSVATGLASALSTSEALGCWVVWSVTFAIATLGVRGVIARTRREPWRALCAMAVLVGASAWWALHTLALAKLAPDGLPLALAPAGVLSWASWLPALRAHHLHRIGWSIAAASAITLGLLIRAV